MANHIFILATVMLLAGIFGGLVNFYHTVIKTRIRQVFHDFWLWVSAHRFWYRLFWIW